MAKSTTAVPAAGEPTKAPEVSIAAKLSRESKLAVQRCLDAAPVTLAADVRLGGSRALTQPISLCKEASTQVSVDSSGPGSVAYLGALLAKLNLSLSAANVAVVSDGVFDDKEFDALVKGTAGLYDPIQTVLAKL